MARIMVVSILVPVYNEHRTIETVLEKLLDVTLPCKKEIVVIDDGSTDGTIDILKKYGKKYRDLKILVHEKNMGKGTAIKTGLHKASGDYVLIQDADLEYNPQEIPKLVICLQSALSQKMRLVAVYGSRFMKKNVSITFPYYLGNRFLTILANVVYGLHLTDMETAYKMVSRKMLIEMDIQSSHFDFEPEVTAKLVNRGVHILEIPISYRGRSHSAGKKLTAMDAFEAILAIIRFRF